MYTKTINRNHISWLVVLLAVASLFMMTQLTVQATYCSAGLRFVNETDERVQIFWEDYDGDETLYRKLYSGRSWRVNTYENHRWVVRDMDRNFMQAYTAGCHDDTIVIQPAPGELPPSPAEECRLCEEGVTQMTIELTDRADNGDRHERVRARIGDVDGEVLFDTYNDGNPYGHNGIYEGESFTIDVTPGDTIVLTVQGDNHHNETVKATLVADCSAEGSEGGNSYIMFTVTAAVADNADGEQCEDPAFGDCDECIDGAKELTLRLYSRADNGDVDETIRVRSGDVDGVLLYANSSPLDVGDTFTFDVDAGEEIVITVEGDNHPDETVKARFTADCSLAVGDINGNSYIKFKVTDVVADNSEGDLCGPQEILGD